VVLKTSTTSTYAMLAASAVGGLVLPLGMSSLLPHAAKTALLTTSLLSSAALAIMNKSQYLERQVSEQRAIDGLRKAEHRRTLAREAMSADLEAKIDHMVEMCVLLADLPKPMRDLQLTTLGMPQLIPMFDPPRQPPPPRENVPILALVDPDSEDTGGDFAEVIDWYSQCKRQLMMFVGNQGEGKTNAAHFALYSWLATATAEEFPIIYIFDPHYGAGRDPKYRSTWLGIPRQTEVPKAVSTSVFQGEAEDMEAWLKPLVRLYKHRKANKIDIISGARPVVVLVDELTNHLNLMDEVKAKSVAKILAELGTGAPKFGIYFWGIVHDLAQSATQIPRTLYRQCEIVMGAGMCQDHTQVTNSPKSISKHTVEYATAVRRNTTPGIPAGYATSLPVPDGFLPPSPLSNKEMELEWTIEQTQLDDPDPYQNWDAEFEGETGGQPEDFWEEPAVDTEPAKPKPPKPKPEPKPEPEIKSRDLNEGNTARNWYDAMRAWYLKMDKNVSDDEIREQWAAATGKTEPLTPEQIKYLRDRLERL
jgi:hypothetical protein